MVAVHDYWQVVSVEYGTFLVFSLSTLLMASALSQWGIYVLSYDL